MYCSIVCVKRGEDGCMRVIGYCNSSLNNKNINYHCAMVFLILGFHVNHFVNCGIIVVSCGSRFFFLSINFASTFFLGCVLWFSVPSINSVWRGRIHAQGSSVMCWQKMA
jgi:hypothetical protein